MKKALVKNTVSLYVMNFVKIILPLITLPYLTRAFSKDAYGAISYVKAIMQYMQIIIDFGFILSSTKDIVIVKDDKKKLSKVIGDTLLAKIILSLVAFIVLLIITFNNVILKKYILLTFLSFGTVFLSCFLMDYVFRGIEEMHVISIRYILMRGLSTGLTFFLVKSDKDILWVPLLDIIGSICAIILIFVELKKREIKIQFTNLVNAIRKIKESAIYFISSMATTTFTALNTLLIGIYINTEDVANWTICMQLVSAVQSCYTPITDGLYPHMVKTKDLKLIKKTAIIFMTLITCGCIVIFAFAKFALLVIGGEKYINAAHLMRAFIPLLFFSFPAMLLGWPTLGSIGKVKETTRTTLITAIIQIIGLYVLVSVNKFTIYNLAILRGLTEAIMFIMRLIYCICYREEYSS